MTVKRFLVHLLLMALFILLVIFGLMFWLKNYTNHGQQLELPDYVGLNLEVAQKDATDKTFELIIKDSIHKVGVPGGEILDQNPTAYSKVKENRKVYVTTAKYNADLINLEDLPSLYGKEFENKKRELGYLDIESVIKGYSYDPGEPDHILEVWKGDRKVISSSGNAKGITIEKGGSLSFVLSKRGGGELEIPDLKCMTLSAAKFLLDTSNLKLGDISEEGAIKDPNSAYIISQDPPYSVSGLISMDTDISITISQERPKYCR